MKYNARATQSKKSLNDEGQRPFAVFDIDGTLIRWQLYHAVVGKLANANLLGENTATVLKAARRKWKNREHGDAFREYEKQLVICYEDALKSLKPKDFDAMVREVIEEYKDQVYTYTRDLITSLQKKNYLLLAISGSHEELVSAIASYYGFDDYKGTNYERRQDRFSGKKYIASHNKKIVLESLIEKYRLGKQDSIAIGDSLSDASMLKIVEQPIAFNPDKMLYNEAMKYGWKIVVERKNVIYTMEKHDGSYILV